MNLNFNIQLADNYKSLAQKARVLSENWVAENIFCPNCGGYNIIKYANNQPVADFNCPNCNEDYELKSEKSKNKMTNFSVKIPDGAYHTMLKRISSDNNPNFFFLNYNLATYEVLNFMTIPKYFFSSEVIEQRNALSEGAVRRGWVGCNILLNKVPDMGRIYYIKNRIVEPKEYVVNKWRRTLFLRDTTENKSRSWLIDIISCVEKIGKKNFSLQDMYSFENILQQKHPNNKFIRDKIRQQLQILRDKDYIEFVSRGNYRLLVV